MWCGLMQGTFQEWIRSSKHVDEMAALSNVDRQEQTLVFFAPICQQIPHAISRPLCSVPPYANGFLTPLAVTIVLCHHIQTDS
jgi:hypothetical protein